MLGSLLPGVREVRTPLTVGYLWLLVAWLAFADRFPTERPDHDGLTARLFDLGVVVGPAIALAALSFIAYLIGALLSLDPYRGRLGYRVADALLRLHWRWELRHPGIKNYRDNIVDPANSTLIASAFGWDPTHAVDLATRAEVEFEAALLDALRRTDLKASRERGRGLEELLEAGDVDELDFHLPEDLRSALLVGNQELYGEYDRIASEGEFRMNLVAPLAVMGFVIAFVNDNLYGLLLLLLAATMMYQGTTRVGGALALLNRAVARGIIKTPLEERLDAQSS